MQKYKVSDDDLTPDAPPGMVGYLDVYLASEVDARIAELEKALRQTDCKCRQASETPYFYVPVVSYKCPRCAALSL